MGLSLHNILRIQAKATSFEGGNWIELTFDIGDETKELVMTWYVERVPGSDAYCQALANAINSVPVPAQARVEILRTLVPSGEPF